jgi:hypothetical protein
MLVKAIMGKRVLVHLIESAASDNERLKACLERVNECILQIPVAEELRPLISGSIMQGVEEYCIQDKVSLEEYIDLYFKEYGIQIKYRDISPLCNLEQIIENAVEITSRKIVAVGKISERLEAFPLPPEIHRDLLGSVKTYIEKDYSLGGISLSQSLEFNLQYLSDKRRLQKQYNHETSPSNFHFIN